MEYTSQQEYHWFSYQPDWGDSAMMQWCCSCVMEKQLVLNMNQTSIGTVSMEMYISVPV